MTRPLRTLARAITVVVLTAGCGTPAATPETGPDAGGPTVPDGAPSGTASGETAAAPSAASGAPPAVSGPVVENAYLSAQITEAGFWPDRPAPPGLRYYTVGLRGTSRSDSDESLMGRSKGNDVIVDVRRFVFAENDRGCLSRPEQDVAGVANAFGDSITFPATGQTAGRLVFLVPDDTARVRVLIAPSDEGRLAVPAGPDFTPSWPTPLHTIQDGSTLRVHVLPSPPPPAAFPPAAAGREHVIVDVVVENVTASQGVEFQTTQQLRLVDAAGRFVQASALSAELGCRLDDGDVVPPGRTRRLQMAFDVPAGAPRRLQYRGFETDDARVDLR